MGLPPLRCALSLLGHARTSHRRPCPSRDHAAAGWRTASQGSRPSPALPRRADDLARRLPGCRELSRTRAWRFMKNWRTDSGIAASLNALGIAARDRGDYASAQKNLERSLACWRMLSDRLAIARCLHNLANVAKVRGDYPRARWALDEAAGIFDQIGDRSGAAWSLNQQGDIARAMGDLTAARALYQRALAAFRQSNDSWGIARSLTDLGYIDCEQGDLSAARAAYREALEIFSGLGHRRGIARALEGCACLALTKGQAARAVDSHRRCNPPAPPDLRSPLAIRAVEAGHHSAACVGIAYRGRSPTGAGGRLGDEP